MHWFESYDQLIKINEIEADKSGRYLTEIIVPK